MSNNEIEETLKERRKDHGLFLDNATVSQNIKTAMENTPFWKGLPVDMQEALHMVAFKASRIITGDCNHIDSWHDIVGYAKLIENRLIEEQETNTPPENMPETIPHVISYKFMGHITHPFSDLFFPGCTNAVRAYISNKKFVFLTRDNVNGYVMHQMEPTFSVRELKWYSGTMLSVKVGFRGEDPLPLSLLIGKSIIAIQLY